MNFGKFLRTPSLTEHLRWLLLHVRKETWMKESTEVSSNYGKYICYTFGWDTVKIRIIWTKVQFIVWNWKDVLLNDLFYIVNYLLMKYSQALSNSMRKSLIFCFCNCLFLVDLKIYVWLNRDKPFLELSINCNQTTWDLSESISGV